MKFSVVGSQVDSSFSPLLHSWIYQNLNLNHQYNYIKLFKDDVDTIVDKIKQEDLNGVNITMPFKRSIISYIDELDSLSREIGAVNCLVISNNHIGGYNTDLFGFEKLIEVNNINLHDKRILVLGSGGVSRTISLFLRNSSLNFSVFNRDKQNLNSMLYDLSIEEIPSFNQFDKTINLNINMVINCLPPTVNYSTLLKKLLPHINEFHTIVDINYNPFKKELNSKHFINGLDMFIFQAIKSNEIWMNKNILKDVDYNSLKSYIEGKIKC